MIYVAAAYLIAAAIVGGYAWSVALRRRHVERALAAWDEDDPAPRGGAAPRAGTAPADTASDDAAATGDTIASDAAAAADDADARDAEAPASRIPSAAGDAAGRSLEETR